MQVAGNASLSDVVLSHTYRVISTAALLAGPSAFAILGNETIRKAESTSVEVQPLVSWNVGCDYGCAEQPL